MARAVKNTFNDIGTLDPSNDRIPIENAISVADGIAHPFKYLDYLYLCKYILAQELTSRQ